MDKKLSWQAVSVEGSAPAPPSTPSTVESLWRLRRRRHECSGGRAFTAKQLGGSNQRLSGCYTSFQVMTYLGIKPQGRLIHRDVWRQGGWPNPPPCLVKISASQRIYFHLSATTHLSIEVLRSLASRKPPSLDTKHPARRAAKPLPALIAMRPVVNNKQDGVIEHNSWPTSNDWERYKPTIINLYKSSQMRFLITEMKDRHNFKATYVSASCTQK